MLQIIFRKVFSHLTMMLAVRNCGCDEILDRDPSKYDINRHYFTCHHSTFDLTETGSIVTNPPTDTKEEIIPPPSSPKADLEANFDDWMTKVLDDEAGRTRTTDVSKKINESLSRQLQDGLLSYYEYIDLEYIGRLWIRLLNSIHRYHLGCGCNKRDILSILLELFELKQIPESLFIESVLQL